jgi:hypothetical protein
VQLVEKAAAEICSMLSSLQLRKYPQLAQLVGPDVIEGAGTWINEMVGVVRAVEQMKQMQGQRQPMVNQAYAGVNQNPPMGQRPQPTGNMFVGGNMPQSAVQQSGGSMYRRADSPAVVEELRMTPGGIQAESWPPADPIKMRNPSGEDFFDALHATSGNPVQEELRQSDQANASALNTAVERLYDFVEDAQSGATVRPAYQCKGERDWIPTPTARNPYTKAYDPATHVMFLAKYAPDESGRRVVVELLMPWKPNMDYMQNEISAEFRSRVPKDPNAPKIIPNFSLLQNLEKSDRSDIVMTAVEPLAEHLVDVPYVVPEQMAEVTITSALDVASWACQLGDMEVVRDGDNTTYRISPCIEYYTDLITTSITSQDTSASILALGQCESIEDAVKMLVGMASKIDQKLWTVLHDRLTSKVNQALEFNLQLKGWRISSVTEDYQDLIKMLVELYGDTMSKVFKTHGKELIKVAFGILTGEKFNQYYQNYLPDNTDNATVESAMERLVLFTDRCAVTEMPWNASDLSIEFRDSGAITAAILPGIHRAVKALMARTDKIGGQFSHYYLRTDDGVQLEIHRGWLGEDYYLISQVPTT